MITIDSYTGWWQAALTPTPTAPKVGSLVRVAWEPDAREYDDFMRVLGWDKRDIKFERSMPRKKMDVYKVCKL